MNRVRRLAMLLMERYGERFTEDFEENKRVLQEVAIITSKQLRNEIAGYITAQVKARRSPAREEVVMAEAPA